MRQVAEDGGDGGGLLARGIGWRRGEVREGEDRDSGSGKLSVMLTGEREEREIAGCGRAIRNDGSQLQVKLTLVCTTSRVGKFPRPACQTNPPPASLPCQSSRHRTLLEDARFGLWSLCHTRSCPGAWSELRNAFSVASVAGAAGTLLPPFPLLFQQK